MAMSHKGIEYQVLPTTTPDLWNWSFQPPERMPVQGTTLGDSELAIAAVKNAIDEWLRANSTESGKYAARLVYFRPALSANIAVSAAANSARSSPRGNRCP